jgi:hypothetical protein
MLNQEQRDRYQRDGYLVLPDFKSMADIARLRARARGRDRRPSTDGVARHSTMFIAHVCTAGNAPCRLVPSNSQEG